MTPAVNLAEKSNITYHLHHYPHDDKNLNYGDEAVIALGLPADRVFKTLIVSLDGSRLGVAVLPVAHQLSFKLCAKALEAKKVTMADKSKAQRASGYVLGGVSPLAQKRSLVTVIDNSAQAHETIYVSGGKRGLEIELAPADLAQLCSATFSPVTAL